MKMVNNLVIFEYFFLYYRIHISLFKLYNKIITIKKKKKKDNSDIDVLIIKVIY